MVEQFKARLKALTIEKVSNNINFLSPSEFFSKELIHKDKL